MMNLTHPITNKRHISSLSSFKVTFGHLSPPRGFAFVLLQALVVQMGTLGRFMTTSAAFHSPSSLVNCKGVLRGYCPLQFYCKPLEFVALSTGQSKAYAAGFTGIYRRPTTNYERLTLISVRASLVLFF